jgi:hypothetical protein
MGGNGQQIMTVSLLTLLCLLRYVIRLQASDGRGGWATQDHVVIVRKRGDTAESAPCCR